MSESNSEYSFSDFLLGTLVTALFVSGSFFVGYLIGKDAGKNECGKKVDELRELNNDLSDTLNESRDTIRKVQESAYERGRKDAYSRIHANGYGEYAIDPATGKVEFEFIPSPRIVVLNDSDIPPAPEFPPQAPRPASCECEYGSCPCSTCPTDCDHWQSVNDEEMKSKAIDLEVGRWKIDPKTGEKTFELRDLRPRV